MRQDSREGADRFDHMSIDEVGAFKLYPQSATLKMLSPMTLVI